MVSKHFFWLTEATSDSVSSSKNHDLKLIDGISNSGAKITMVAIEFGCSFSEIKEVQGGFHVKLHGKGESQSEIVLALAKKMNLEKMITDIIVYSSFGSMNFASQISKEIEAPLTIIFQGGDFESFILDSTKRLQACNALSQCKNVITTTRKQRDKVQVLFPAKQVYWIPNSVDFRHWQPSSSDYNRAENWRNTHLKKDHKIIGMLDPECKRGSIFQVSLETDIQRFSSHFLSELLEFSNSDELISLNGPKESMWFLLASDILAFSEAEDRIPESLIAAGSLGLPFMAQRTEALEDVFHDGKHCLLLDDQAVENVVELLERFVLLSANELKTMGQSVFEIVDSSFTMDNEVESYLRILNDSHFNTLVSSMVAV